MSDVATNGSQQDPRDQAITHIEHLHELAARYKRAYEQLAQVALEVARSAAPASQDESLVDRHALNRLATHVLGE